MPAEAAIDGSKRASPEIHRANVGMVLVAILSFSIATGIWMAMLEPDGFSQVQAAFSAFIPARSR